MPRWVAWLVAALVAFFLIIVGLIVAFVFFVLGVVRASPGHVCASYYVRQNATARRIAGLPLTDAGFPSASSSYEAGTLTYHETFTLRGPKGSVDVEARGVRSEFESHLDVRMASSGNVTDVYSGTFDCPPLHARSR